MLRPQKWRKLEWKSLVWGKMRLQNLNLVSWNWEMLRMRKINHIHNRLLVQFIKSVYKELVDTTYQTNQLSRLVVVLPNFIDYTTKDSMKELIDKVENLCVRAEVLESAFTTMYVEVYKRKGKGPYGLWGWTHYGRHKACFRNYTKFYWWADRKNLWQCGEQA